MVIPPLWIVLHFLQFIVFYVNETHIIWSVYIMTSVNTYVCNTKMVLLLYKMYIWVYFFMHDFLLKYHIYHPSPPFKLKRGLPITNKCQFVEIVFITQEAWELYTFNKKIKNKNLEKTRRGPFLKKYRLFNIYHIILLRTVLDMIIFIL